jgi:thiol-disulfide isomerase/thioredoxin
MPSRRIFIVSGISLAASGRALASADAPFLKKYSSLRLDAVNGFQKTLAELAPVGRPAIIHFWASWCAPCAEETRHLSELRAKISSDKLSLLGIHVKMENESPAKVDNFLRTNNGYTYPHVTAERYVYDLFNSSGFLGRRFLSLPKLYIFDKSGRIVQKYSGMSTENMNALDVLVSKLDRL